MLVTAKFRYLHIAPRKVRLVVDSVRGKKVEQAQTILTFMVKRSAAPMLKLLNSAVANAENSFQLDKSNLYIAKITVDEGPKYKRWHAQSRGRAAEILKRTSHVTIVLEETEPQAVKTKKKEDKPEKKTTKAVKAKKALPKIEKNVAQPKTQKTTKKTYRRKAF
ncbi:50S ribosomal protein L22 [Candidatus Parcubacteria bacterium]|nr:50S ribosomal protein L22 [Candidatus Parcubacteria bacterium]